MVSFQYILLGERELRGVVFHFPKGINKMVHLWRGDEVETISSEVYSSGIEVG